MSKFIFTSESVSEGHPDKICDQVSDAIVDYYLENCKTPELARVACETMVTTNKVFIAGEVRGDGDLVHINNKHIDQITRSVIKSIGYEQSTFHWDKVNIDINLHNQSPDISMGVDAVGKNEEGAGDQGIMFGYATNETDAYMPLPIQLSHQLLKSIRNKRLNSEVTGLGPDAKSQFSIIYKENKPTGVHSIVLSIQHINSYNTDDIKQIMLPVIRDILPNGWECPDENILINPTGRFEIGGPHGDAGLTGRKIVVDTYGGVCPHGGGAFSGKDPSKVDRSGAYAARYIAKNLVAAGVAEKCTLQLAYVIGVADPVSIFLDTHNTSKIDNKKIVDVIKKIFQLTPAGIREMLKLAKPIYQKTSYFGHFGREDEGGDFFPWEKLDKVEEIKRLF
ncbi:MAG: S-adenosylmethionine synthase [Alphaproteobacteria bacterium MarineAlpha9_Bin4]|nr:methionine adenosyltransferase [Pelagibacterales bacterium]PPR26593.1 MAG: S-adenosylmethionine synthase [Alphaproteobacteria bacterium MarineAlpha9_Bin4]|tara:strand:- start:539 stop:1717 length:1179 start_codon:yes stop_codon:yes gene_type:complete